MLFGPFDHLDIGCRIGLGKAPFIVTIAVNTIINSQLLCHISSRKYLFLLATSAYDREGILGFECFGLSDPPLCQFTMIDHGNQTFICGGSKKLYRKKSMRELSICIDTLQQCPHPTRYRPYYLGAFRDSDSSLACQCSHCIAALLSLMPNTKLCSGTVVTLR